MIQLKNVSKHFGRTDVLKDINLEIDKGEIVGFLGQNGAGKTTLMRLLTSYLLPASGDVLIDGRNTREKSLILRRMIGYLPETAPLYPQMRVLDYLYFAARLKDIPGKSQKMQVEKVLIQCQLMDVRHKPIAHLSKGFRQRVGIAQAIIHEPPILILDEPTSGLDPLQIHQVRQLMKGLEKQRTVILSTHILSEIEQMAKRVIIIKDGQILIDQLLESILKNPEGLRRFFVRFKGEMVGMLEHFHGLQGYKVMSAKTFDGIHQLDVEWNGSQKNLHGLIEHVLKGRGQIIDIEEQKINLEQFFLRLHQGGAS